MPSPKDNHHEDRSPATGNALGEISPGAGKTSTKDQPGNGGELHQDVGSKAADPSAFLTDNFGHRIVDNQNSLKAGERGPTLLEDFVLREKSSISTMSAFRSASSMRGDRAHTACSNAPRRYRN